MGGCASFELVGTWCLGIMHQSIPAVYGNGYICKKVPQLPWWAKTLEKMPRPRGRKSGCAFNHDELHAIFTCPVGSLDTFPSWRGNAVASVNTHSSSVDRSETGDTVRQVRVRFYVSDEVAAVTLPRSLSESRYYNLVVPLGCVVNSEMWSCGAPDWIWGRRKETFRTSGPAQSSISISPQEAIAIAIVGRETAFDLPAQFLDVQETRLDFQLRTSFENWLDASI